jgi:hypothetical protein
LESKTYNEEYIKGTNAYYRAEIKKLEVKVKFLEEKTEDGETMLGTAVRERERLEG